MVTTIVSPGDKVFAAPVEAVTVTLPPTPAFASTITPYVPVRGSPASTRLAPVESKATDDASGTPSGPKTLNAPASVELLSDILVPGEPAVPSNSSKPTFPPGSARTLPAPPIAIRP